MLLLRSFPFRFCCSPAVWFCFGTTSVAEHSVCGQAGEAAERKRRATDSLSFLSSFCCLFALRILQPL